jgi:hypothetical protein
MMKPQRRATTENRIRLASDARTIPGEPRQAVFVASFVAKSPRTARLGIAKRVESLSEPPLSARVSHFRHASAAPAEAVSAPISRSTRCIYLSLAARACLGHIGR